MSARLLASLYAAFALAVSGLAAWGCSETIACNARCGPERTGHDGPFEDCRCVRLEAP